MRALLKPILIPELGIVAFKPGSQLYPYFHRGRMLIENEPERLAGYASGAIPSAVQPLAEDPVLQAVFADMRVLQRAGGINGLETWLQRESGCQWPHSDYHADNMTTLRHEPGVIRLCWHCDNKLREHTTETLAAIARANCAAYIILAVRTTLGFDDTHALTLPELCWWLAYNNLADAIPEGAARQVLRMPAPVIQSVTREADIVPTRGPTEIVQETAKKVLALKIDPETPESFMRRPKRRRWENEKYTRWVKAQTCACCNQPADDPHHIIGHGQGGMGTKAHDLFVIPLCRAHHDELHRDPVAFEAKYGSQLTLLFRFIDHALAIGVLA